MGMGVFCEFWKLYCKILNNLWKFPDFLIFNFITRKRKSMSKDCREIYIKKKITIIIVEICSINWVLAGGMT